jgi:hypothetical protein
MARARLATASRAGGGPDPAGRVPFKVSPVIFSVRSAVSFG